MALKTTALIVPELNGKFQLTEVSLDDLKPDEVLVEIHASGVCHTDLSCASGVLPCAPNAVLGHEGAGVIVELGYAVPADQFAVGDKVLLSFAHCNSCPTCLAGHPGYCYKFMDLNFGGHRQDGSATTTLTTADGTEKPMFSAFFGQSSFSRLAAVHRSSVVRVPADTPLDLFAPLGCGIQTGFGAVQNALKVTPGSSVAIFGVGSVGMAAVMGAKACGATTIIAVDLQAERLELAKELGATHGLLGNVGREKLIEEIQAICPPFGVDFAVDCSGVPAVIETMVAALGMMGCAATVGAPEVTKNASINIMDHLTHGRSYIGCTEGDSVPSKSIPYLIEQHKKGLLPLEKIVQYYDVLDFEQALADMHNGKTIKAVLRWA